MSPTITDTIRFTSAPVLLKAMPIDSTEAEAKPSPRFNSAAPVACSASLPSPRIASATVALRTPARRTLPAFKPAEALFETTSNSSAAGELPRTRSTPKSPDSVTNPATWACKPLITTDAWPLRTLSGALTVVAPTETVSVRFNTSAPVLLKATPIEVAEAVAKPSPRFKSAAPVA